MILRQVWPVEIYHLAKQMEFLRFSDRFYKQQQDQNFSFLSLQRRAQN